MAGDSAAMMLVRYMGLTCGLKTVESGLFKLLRPLMGIVGWKVILDQGEMHFRPVAEAF